MTLTSGLAACLSPFRRDVRELLEDSGLLKSPNGMDRCSYCFRHTYATFRLMEGIDVYFLAKQMGTSVKMIEDHYGHITRSKNAELILHGIPGWEPADHAPEATGAAAPAAKLPAPKARKPQSRKRTKAAA